MVNKPLDLKRMTRRLQLYFREHHRMPSVSEFAELFDYASKGAAWYVIEKMVDANILTKDDSGKLILKKRPGTYPILGSIAAGLPEMPNEELIDTISFDDYLIEKPNATFLVRVNGDSMCDAGVKPGDIVIVEKGKNPKPHDMVIAQVDGDWTMKYFEKEEGEIVLVPANPKYKPIRPIRTLIVWGVVISMIRKF